MFRKKKDEQNEQKRILVTGATGFLGKYVVQELLENGYHVIACGRNKERLLALEEMAKNDRGMDAGNLEVYQWDLSEIQEKKMKVDCVIHAAALSTVWGKWKDFYDTNVIGTWNVVLFCRRNKVKRLVYVSSPSIYTQKKDRFDIEEDSYHRNNKLNYYIRTKLLAEKLVGRAAHKGIETVIIRPRGLFGIGDTSIIPRLINANRGIGIPLFRKGKNVVDITCVENVALALRLAAESEKAVGKTYNISNGEPREFKEILEELFEQLGEEPHYRKLPFGLMYRVAGLLELSYKIRRKYEEPVITKYTMLTLGYSQTLNIEKAKADLGYEPKITLSEGIKKYALDCKAKEVSEA